MARIRTVTTRCAATGSSSVRNARSRSMSATADRERSASQLARLRGGTFVARAPALHPGLDLVPRYAHAGALELGEAARVLLQHVGRPRSLAFGALLREIGGQNVVIASDVREKLGDTDAARMRPRLEQIRGF